MSRREYESLLEAGVRTGVSVRMLRRRIAAGQLRAYHSGPRIIRLDPKDVDGLVLPMISVTADHGVVPRR